MRNEGGKENSLFHRKKVLGKLVGRRVHVVRCINVLIEGKNEKEIKGYCTENNRYVRDLCLHVTSLKEQPGEAG